MNYFNINSEGFFSFWTLRASSHFSYFFSQDNFKNVVKLALKQKHNFIMLTNRFTSCDFSDDHGIITGIKINPKVNIKGSDLLLYKKTFGSYSDFEYYRRKGYSCYLRTYIENEFVCGTLSEYTTDLEKIDQEFLKISKLATLYTDIYANFSLVPNSQKKSSKKVNVKIYLYSQDLYELKESTKVLRSIKHDTKEYFFQGKEWIPFMEQISKIATPNPGTAKYRLVPAISVPKTGEKTQHPQ